jgi:hypothetical protein
MEKETRKKTSNYGLICPAINYMTGIWENFQKGVLAFGWRIIISMCTSCFFPPSTTCHVL